MSTTHDETKKATHSPLPWKAVPEYPEDAHPYEQVWRIEPITQDDGMTYGYRWLREADAEFICRAVNSHEELLAALKAVIANHCADARLYCSTCTPARALIEKAQAR